jgi:hypothetical protein
MITLCPTNCEHDYPFQHSIVVTSRKVKIGDKRVMRVWTFVICRACGHSIDRDGCAHYCHVEEGGTMIVDYALDNV